MSAYISTCSPDKLTDMHTDSHSKVVVVGCYWDESDAQQEIAMICSLNTLTSKDGDLRLSAPNA